MGNPAPPIGPTAPIGQIAALIDQVIADPAARDAAKLRLIALQPALADFPDPDSPDPDPPATDPPPVDLWTARARPAFLYVMYVLLLWAIPMGVIAAFRPAMAAGIARGMTAYLNGIPEPLYALFGTGYLGYTVARTWGKAKGVER